MTWRDDLDPEAITKLNDAQKAVRQFGPDGVSARLIDTMANRLDHDEAALAEARQAAVSTIPSVPVVSEPTEPKPKRTRRTKEQKAADEAAALQAGLPSLGDMTVGTNGTNPNAGEPVLSKLTEGSTDPASGSGLASDLVHAEPNPTAP